MSELSESIERWRKAGERIALATVINVDGSAPRGEGAKMAIAESGKIEGSVSGGCVESAVAQAALDVLATGKPAIERYGINRNMMWDVGLSCGGAIDVFIEPLASDSPSPGPDTPAVCTLVRGDAQAIGRKLFVNRRGALDGTLGDTSLDSELAERARALIAAGRSQIVKAGDWEVFVDVFVPDARLILVGAVHIAESLCKMAAIAGFSVTVIDPRPALCNRERFPDAQALLLAWPDEALQNIEFDENTYVAVLTHDEKFDDPTLVRVLQTPARYVGAIGSKKTQTLRRQRLIDAGIALEKVDRLHGPIGLDIGAESPEEIAASILAEMIAVKHHRSGIPLRDRSEEHIHA